MLNNQRRVKVINRTDGSLAYHIESLRITRHWRRPGDYLNIPVSELIELRTAPGGMYTLENCIVIEDEDAVAAIFDDKEMPPEFKYGVKEVDFLLYEAELEQLLDALDYAPQGVLELLFSKSKSKLPNTTAKISAINDKFDANISQIFDLMSGDDNEGIQSERPISKRRAAPIEVDQKEVVVPKYNVINEK